MELTILIPCLNEANSIGFCIAQAQKSIEEFGLEAEILIADNGSTDESVLIAEQIGARVITVEKRGYGAALIGGIHAARGRTIVMGDADGSYDFSDIQSFILCINARNILVVGNRFKGGIEKWAFSFAVFGKTAVESAWTRAMVRVDGGVTADNAGVELTRLQRLTGAVWHNLGCLFPIRETMSASQVMLWTFVVLLVVVALFYLFHEKEVHGTLFVPLFLLALLPYARLLVLSNHACRHYFFTYRAQLITVFVLLVFIVMNILPGMKKVVNKR